MTFGELCAIIESLPKEPAPLGGAWSEWNGPECSYQYLCARRLETIDGVWFVVMSPADLKHPGRDDIARMRQRNALAQAERARSLRNASRTLTIDLVVPSHTQAMCGVVRRWVLGQRGVRLKLGEGPK